MFSLGYLHQKNEEMVTYLQSRHVLPFYYKCLNDKDPELQTIALMSIKNIGTQGEQLLSEGISKDSNHIIRSQCAIGLGSINN